LLSSRQGKLEARLRKREKKVKEDKKAREKSNVDAGRAWYVVEGETVDRGQIGSREKEAKKAARSKRNMQLRCSSREKKEFAPVPNKARMCAIA